MDDLSRLKGLVKRVRKSAKFVNLVPSGDFIDESAGLTRSFFAAYVYDENVSSDYIESNRKDLVLVCNSYISSFAYNLLLCSLYCQETGRPERLDELLEHNLRKFFAEQAYRHCRRLPARGLVLWALFESDLMNPLIDFAQEQRPFGETVDVATSLMNSLLDTHELGHYFVRNVDQAWEEFILSQHPAIRSLFEAGCGQLSSAEAEEYKCDLMAVTKGYDLYRDRLGASLALKAIAYGYSAYSAMYALSASAEETARSWEELPEVSLDLATVGPLAHVDYDWYWVPNPDFGRRARFAVDLCVKLGRLDGIDIVRDKATLPISSSIVEDMESVAYRCLSTGRPFARTMGDLVGRSLAGHADGMDFLYLRSKKFRFGPDSSQLP